MGSILMSTLKLMVILFPPTYMTLSSLMLSFYVSLLSLSWDSILKLIGRETFTFWEVCFAYWFPTICISTSSFWSTSLEYFQVTCWGLTMSSVLVLAFETDLKSLLSLFCDFLAFWSLNVSNSCLFCSAFIYLSAMINFFCSTSFFRWDCFHYFCESIKNVHFLHQ